MNNPALRADGSADKALLVIIERLPPLPKTIYYEDDYDEVVRSVVADGALDEFSLVISGEKLTVSLRCFTAPLRTLVHHFLLYELQDAAPQSVYCYFAGLRRFSNELLSKFAVLDPLILRREWVQSTDGYFPDVLMAVKSFLRYLCDLELGGWSLRFRRMVSTLNVPNRDAYAVVRSGDCFLGVDEEAALIRWIDKQVAAVAALSTKELQRASLVICSYQFGMRPKQLGTLRKRDCEIRVNSEDGHASVYLTFRLLKQKDVQASRFPMQRKIKREWAPVLVATFEKLASEPSSAFFFGFQSRSALSEALITQLDAILPGCGRSAYDLRHSMAQRMVDSGANKEELAAALGHMSLQSGQVYFQTSANQAELVNKALGASEVYQQVAKISADRFISEKELAKLKGEQQIAGVPHGIPIAGIGGCKSGQPACPYNPVTACYGCPKFMPLRDLRLHKQVLTEFRSIVNDFRFASEGDEQSPTYLQLRQTIAEVQGVIQQLEENDV